MLRNKHKKENTINIGNCFGCNNCKWNGIYRSCTEYGAIIKNPYSTDCKKYKTIESIEKNN